MSWLDDIKKAAEGGDDALKGLAGWGLDNPMITLAAILGGSQLFGGEESEKDRYTRFLREQAERRAALEKQYAPGMFDALAQRLGDKVNAPRNVMWSKGVFEPTLAEPTKINIPDFPEATPENPKNGDSSVEKPIVNNGEEFPEIPEIPQVDLDPNLDITADIEGLSDLPVWEADPEIPDIPKIPQVDLDPNLDIEADIEGLPNLPVWEADPEIPPIPQVDLDPNLDITADIEGLPKLPAWEADPGIPKIPQVDLDPSLDIEADMVGLPKLPAWEADPPTPPRPDVTWPKAPEIDPSIHIPQLQGVDLPDIVLPEAPKVDPSIHVPQLQGIDLPDVVLPDPPTPPRPDVTWPKAPEVDPSIHIPQLQGGLPDVVLPDPPTPPRPDVTWPEAPEIDPSIHVPQLQGVDLPDVVLPDPEFTLENPINVDDFRGPGIGFRGDVGWVDAPGWPEPEFKLENPINVADFRASLDPPIPGVPARPNVPWPEAPKVGPGKIIPQLQGGLPDVDLDVDLPKVDPSALIPQLQGGLPDVNLDVDLPKVDPSALIPQLQGGLPDLDLDVDLPKVDPSKLIPQLQGGLPDLDLDMDWIRDLSIPASTPTLSWLKNLAQMPGDAGVFDKVKEALNKVKDEGKDAVLEEMRELADKYNINSGEIENIALQPGSYGNEDLDRIAGETGPVTIDPNSLGWQGGELSGEDFIKLQDDNQFGGMIREMPTTSESVANVIEDVIRNPDRADNMFFDNARSFVANNPAVQAMRLVEGFLNPSGGVESDVVRTPDGRVTVTSPAGTSTLLGTEHAMNTDDSPPLYERTTRGSEVTPSGFTLGDNYSSTGDIYDSRTENWEQVLPDSSGQDNQRLDPAEADKFKDFFDWASSPEGKSEFRSFRQQIFNLHGRPPTKEENEAWTASRMKALETPPQITADQIYDSWNLALGEPGFNPAADANNDGIINSLDLQFAS